MLISGLKGLMDINVLLVWSEVVLSAQFLSPLFLNFQDPPLSSAWDLYGVIIDILLTL